MVTENVSQESFDAAVEFLWRFNAKSFKNWDSKGAVRKYVMERIKEVSTAVEDIYYTNSAGLFILIDNEGEVDIFVDPVRWARWYASSNIEVPEVAPKQVINFY